MVRMGCAARMVFQVCREVMGSTEPMVRMGLRDPLAQSALPVNRELLERPEHREQLAPQANLVRLVHQEQTGQRVQLDPPVRLGARFWISSLQTDISRSTSTNRQSSSVRARGHSRTVSKVRCSTSSPRQRRIHEMFMLLLNTCATRTVRSPPWDRRSHGRRFRSPPAGRTSRS